MAEPPVVALELGTSKVCALVGEMREDGSLMITGLGECPSRGVRKGRVVDLENAVACARTALHMAEENGQVAIGEVHVAVSGGHVESTVNRGSVPVLDPEDGITVEDIAGVKEVARAANLSQDRQFIHTVAQHYYIDEHGGVVNPKGMVGARLSLDMLIVHGVRGPLQNILNVVRSVPMDVCEPAFSGLCSALAVLSAEQKRNGVALIDLGGGTTDYIVYAGNTLAAAGSVAVGGDHITNDIVSAFSIPTSEAERLKRRSGPAVQSGADKRRHITLKPELGFPARSLSVADLETVINLRAEETLMLVRSRLGSELLEHVGAGIVLTGGGAYLQGIEDLASQVFSIPAVIGRPRSISGLGIVTERPEYATPLGLVRYGFRPSEQTRKRRSIRDWFRGLVE